MKSLIIPVEIKTRELIAKILLGCFAVERGYSVHLGSQQRLFDFVVPSLPPSIVIEHDFLLDHKVKFQLLQKMGHKIACWDEEAIAQPSADWYVNRRVNASIIRMCEACFTWGDEQTRWITDAHPDLEGRITTVGNPRVDVLRPEFRQIFDTESLPYQERFGRYILINSNFSRVNLFHLSTEDFINSVIAAAKLSPEWQTYFRAFIDNSRRTFLTYLESLPLLAARYPDTNIVVRPHPSENPQTWRDAAAGLANVHVIYQGTANGWIAGARALVHSGCTTAIEAAILGVPTISFLPFQNERFDLVLPGLLSSTASHLDEVIEQLDAVIAGKQIFPSISEPANPIHRYISALQGPFACERILDHIESIRTNRGDWLYRMYRYLRLNASLLRHKYVSPPARNNYVEHKFPPTPLAEIDEIVRELSSRTDRFRNIRVSMTQPNCFHLEPIR